MNAHNLDSVGSLSANPATLYVPAATSSQCLGCDADIVRYGDDDARYCAACSKCRSCDKEMKLYGFEIVKLCDDCLDCLEGIREVAAAKGPIVDDVLVDSRCEHEPNHDEEDEDEEDTDADAVQRIDLDPAGLDEVWGDVATEEVDVADVVECCATCTTATEYRCKCGKLCCVDCVDEVGRCPACDSDG